MAKTKFDIKTEATRPLYASVGVVDRAAELVRGSVQDAQKRLAEVRASVRGIELEPAALQVRARELPVRLQEVLEENEVSYDQLVTRGEVLVASIRNQESTKTTAREAKVTSAKAKTTRPQAKKAGSATSRTVKSAARSTASTATRQATRPKSSAKATGTAARKSAAAGAKAASQAAKKVGD